MITYRTNKAGTLCAAYSHLVRIGYIEKRNAFPNGGWRWQLIFLMPSGGAYMGVEDCVEDAKERLHANYLHWMASAGLAEKQQ